MNEAPHAHVGLGPRELLWTLGAAATAAGFWVGMTAVFDLIFNLHPALVGIVAGWSLRRVTGPGLTAGRAATLAVVSAAGVAGGSVGIAALHGPTDSLPLRIIVAAAGGLLGAALLLRPSAKGASSASSGESGSRRPSEPINWPRQEL
jgi:hypothetical protein